MKVMVTGHLGFVGRETVRVFKEHNIDCVGFDIMECNDVRDFENIRQFIEVHNPDRVLHLAAIARFSDADREPMVAHDINVNGTINVTNACIRNSIPLVFSSTGSAIMPLDRYDAPYREDIPATGNSIYGCTKALGEYAVARHTPHIILRYAHIYGKEKRHHGLVDGFISRIERGLAPTLYGGQQTNDFTYIKDIARANYLAITAPWDKWNQVYHIGTGEEISAKDAGDMVCKYMDYDGEIEVTEKRGVDPGRFVFDISKARKLLGYDPYYSFEDGLIDMLG